MKNKLSFSINLAFNQAMKRVALLLTLWLTATAGFAVTFYNISLSTPQTNDVPITGIIIDGSATFSNRVGGGGVIAALSISGGGGNGITNLIAGVTLGNGIIIGCTNAAEVDPVFTAWLATNTPVSLVGYMTGAQASNSFTGISVTNGLISAVTGPGMTTLGGVVTFNTNGWQFGGSGVTAAITNGLATIVYVNGITNGLATRVYAASLTNGLVTSSVTNGLQIAGAYVTAGITNGLYLASNPSQFVTKAITNGLQTAGAYVTSSITNGLASTAYVAAQGFVTQAVTNGLVKATLLGSAAYSNSTAFAPSSVTNVTLAPYMTLAGTNAFAPVSVTNFAVASLGGLAWSNAATYASQFDRAGASAAVSNTITSLGYVTKTVTNNLATTAQVNAITNGLYSASNPAGYVTQAVTNGLPSASLTNGFYQSSNPAGYVSAAVTNGLYSASNPATYVTKSVTNGMISSITGPGFSGSSVVTFSTSTWQMVAFEVDPIFAYWQTTNTYLKTFAGYMTGTEATNNFAFRSITNGLLTIDGTNALASISYVSSNYLSLAATNGLASSNYVKSVTGPGLTNVNGVVTLSTNDWSMGGTGGSSGDNLFSNQVTTASTGEIISNLASSAFSKAVVASNLADSAYGIAVTASNLAAAGGGYSPTSGVALLDGANVPSIGVSNRVLYSKDTVSTYTAPAFSIDGNDYFWSSGATGLRPAITNLVIVEAWVNPSSLGDGAGVPWRTVFSSGANYYNGSHVFYGISIASNGALASVISTDAGYGKTMLATNTSNLIVTGVWSHVAMTYSNGLVTFFVNGHSVSTTNSGTYMLSNESYDTDTIGLWSPGNGLYAGAFDEIKVSAGGSLYTNGFTPKTCLGSDANTIVYIRVDEGTGTTLGDSVGSASLDFHTYGGSVGWITNGVCIVATNSITSTNASVDFQNHTLTGGWGATTNLGFLNLATNHSTLYITNGLIKGVSTP